MSQKKETSPGQWRQISGDQNPGAYGAIIARFEGESIELLEIQPVRECVGDDEALDVGFPFWTRTAYYTPSELDQDRPEVTKALQCCGTDLASVAPEHRPLVIAECLLRYGYATDEGTGGWARDILGNIRVFWWGSKRACGWRYLADEDQEFRALQRERRAS